MSIKYRVRSWIPVMTAANLHDYNRCAGNNKRTTIDTVVRF
jgi:hypothetical protein